MNNEAQVQKIHDEQFCLSFELQTLSGILNRGELERWVPGFCNPHTELEHIQRYTWVSQFTHGNTVVDIACGTGKGSHIIATDGKAAHVDACDIDTEAVRYASIRYAHPVITHHVKDAETFTIEEPCDVVVSFETIEHLPHPEDFLTHVKSSLIDGGYFFVSTPISGKEVDTTPYNVHHVTEWGFTAFQALISSHFTIEEIYVQLYETKNTNKIKRLIKKILGRSESVVLSDITVWNEQEYPAKSMGVTHKGYQIIRCKK